MERGLSMSEISFTLELPMITNPYSGSITERNLWEAFIAESMAANRYTYYASVAKKSGYEQIAAILSHTADNEREHAKIWFKQLQQLGGMTANLLAAANNEHLEWFISYPKMAQDAYRDGFAELGRLFEAVANIEQHHEEVFRGLLRGVDTDTIFRDTGLILWECRNCGHIELSETAPALCPVCNHPQAFFQRFT